MTLWPLSFCFGLALLAPVLNLGLSLGLWACVLALFLSFGPWPWALGAGLWGYALALVISFGAWLWLLADALAFVPDSDLWFWVFALHFGFGLDHGALALDTGRTLWLWS